MYNATTGAYKRAPQVRPLKKRTIKHRVKTTTRTRIQKGMARRKIGAKIYLVIFLGFLLVMGMVVGNANVTLQRNTNVALMSVLREIELQNGHIYAEIIEARNLDEIEYIARHVLGMSEPLPHQIISIDVMAPRENIHDFTVMVPYELTLVEEVSQWFEQMMDFLFRGGSS